MWPGVIPARIFGFPVFCQAISVGPSSSLPPDVTAAKVFEDSTLSRRFVEGARALAHTASLLSETANRYLRLHDRAADCPILEGPLNAGLFLYALGGEAYSEEAEALLRLLGGVASVDAQCRLLIDWSLTEMRLIQRRMLRSPNFPKNEDTESPEEAWLTALSAEIEFLFPGTRDALGRAGADQVLTSTACRLLRAVRETPPIGGPHPSRLTERKDHISGLLGGVLGADGRIKPEDLETLSERLGRQLSRLEEQENSTLADTELRELSILLLDDLEDLRFARGRKGTLYSSTNGEIVLKFSAGGFLQLLRGTETGLAVLSEAGELARTIATKAAKAPDPRVRVAGLIERWRSAYDEATAQLSDQAEIGDIARTIAGQAMCSRRPRVQVGTLVQRWREAHTEIRAALGEAPWVEELSRTFALEACRSEDPRKQVQVLMDRWQRAKSEASKILGGLPEAGEIERAIASEACTSPNPEDRARQLCRRWREAYAEALRQAGDDEDLAPIARTFAISAFRTASPGLFVRKLAKRWSAAYDEACRLLADVSPGTDIARSLALLACHSKYPRAYVAELVARYKEAAAQVKRELASSEDGPGVVESIALLAARVSDSKTRARELMERWRVAHGAVQNETSGDEEVARMIANAAIGAPKPDKHALILLGRWRKAFRRAADRIGPSGARALAALAFQAEDPVRRVDELMVRWVEAEQEARSALRDLPECGDIAPSIANDACRSPTPRERVRLLVERWREAYQVAQDEASRVPVLNGLERQVANEAFHSANSAAFARVLLNRWRQAYQAVIEERPDAGSRARTIANQAMMTVAPREKALELAQQA